MIIILLEKYEEYTGPYRLLYPSMQQHIFDFSSQGEYILSNKLISYENFDIMLRGLEEYSNNSQGGLVSYCNRLQSME